MKINLTAEEDQQARDAKEDILYGKGFHVLRGRFDPAEALDVVERYVDSHVSSGGQAFSGGYRPPGVEMSAVVQSLMLDRLLLKIGEICIGSRPAYGSLGANCVPEGSEGMDLHIDYPYFAMGHVLPPSSFPALCVQLIWYLTDVGPEDGGCTFLVPATQVSPSRPRAGYEKVVESVSAKAGDVFVGHGAIWHGVSPRLSGGTRHALLGSYVPFWVHPMLVPSYRFSLSDEMDVLLRSDLGVRIGEGYSETTAAARGRR